jgi:hypothetical protein
MSTCTTIKKNEINAICRKMDGTGDNHVELNKPDSERQTSGVF